MLSKFKISDHAYDRFYERFGHVELSIESLLENSFHFGGQKGSEYYLINQDYDVVFPIIRSDREHIVKTVLTVQQAKANLSINTKVLFELEIPKTETGISEPPKKEIPKQVEENNNKLKLLAKEYLEKHGRCPSIQERKQLIKEFKTTLTISNRQFDKFFLYEITRMIRENGI